VHPHAFDYVRASTVSQAVTLLRKHGDRAKVLAGGQSLIPAMKLRLASPEILIDIGRIPGLSSVREDGGTLRIGALTRHRTLEESELIRGRYPLLSDVAKVLGDPEVRNAGTIGGSLAHADPAGDWGAALLASDARIVAVGPKGKRMISIDEFFTDTFTTALEPAEILTEILIPKAKPQTGGAYKKLKRKTGDFATVAVGARVGLGPKGTVVDVRIAMAAVGPTPIRARRAEEFLSGQAVRAENLARAAKFAAEESRPTSDLRGSEAYKRAMVEVFARRALETAVDRAGR